jgi:hypothetical protein
VPSLIIALKGVDGRVKPGHDGSGENGGALTLLDWISFKCPNALI